MNTQPLKYTATNESIVVIHDGKPINIPSNAPNFRPLHLALLDQDWELARKHLTVSGSLEQWSKGKFKLEGKVFYYNGDPLPASLNNRIVRMATNNESPEPLFKFWERLKRNPSWRSVEQLWPFMENEGIAIDDDGFLITYKGVNDNLTDRHTGKIDNSPGAINEMDRNKVSDDPNTACHYGYHVGALQYAKSFASRVVICKVDPEHVVCIPYDSSQHKMRLCKYEVIGFHNGQGFLPSTTMKIDVPTSESQEPTYRDFGDADEVEPDDIEAAGDEEEDEEVDEEGEAHEEVAEAIQVHSKTESLSAAPAKTAEADVKEEEKKEAPSFSAFHKMSMGDLMKQQLGDLRTYAAIEMKIVGASKIRGGKTALVTKILEIRKAPKGKSHKK